jgi:hypothetical protein
MKLLVSVRSGLDLLTIVLIFAMRRTWTGDRSEWTLFVQVLNVLWDENPIGFDWIQYFSRLRSFEDPPTGRSGLPILPSIGLEVAW